MNALLAARGQNSPWQKPTGTAVPRNEAIRRESLQEHYRLQVGDLDSLSTPRRGAADDVVDAHHVVARRGEPPAIVFVGLAR